MKFDNSLAALSAAELVRRLALHRELPKALRFPGAEWTDIQVCGVCLVCCCCVCVSFRNFGA